LLAVLKEAGWTEGTRGPAGGIRLITDPEKINLREVVEAADGPMGITRCLFSSAPCRDQKHCSLRGIWSRAQQEMLKVLEEVNIKDLVEAAALEA
jgi:Rrf2 family protein